MEEFELIPAGVYSAVIEQLHYQEAASEDKYPQLRVEYTILDDGDVKGRKISHWLSFSPKSLGFMKAFFDAFEVDFEELEVDEDSSVVTSPDLSGTVVQIKVLVQPHYQDKSRKVNKINQAPVVVNEDRKPGTRRVAAPSRTAGRAGARPVR